MPLSARSPVKALTILLAHGAAAADWNYPDIDGWGDANPICNNGKHQSPVDFKAASFEVIEDADITLNEADYSQKSGKFHNTGHTVEWALADSEIKPTFSPPNYPNETFSMHHCNFHWGECDDAGSEHTVEGMSYPLEMHCMHLNTKYDGDGSQLSHADGAAVLLFLFDLGTANEDMENIFSNVPLSKTDSADSTLPSHLEANEPGAEDGPSKTDLPEPETLSFDIQASLLDKVDMTKVAWYEGSLTTPNCDEAVTYVMFRDPIEISPDQVASMRKAVLTANEGFNYRPIQNLNDRMLYKNFDEDLPDAKGDGKCGKEAAPVVPHNTNASVTYSSMMLTVCVTLIGILASFA